ncbi:MAG: NADH-quinone oxidoreductase subunit J [Bacteroidetes bacterium]|nr:NADH-quinone oxidoreductase subunit J [Bacteroidota bacterium]
MGAIFFYIISAFILLMGILAVTTRKIFRSAIYLLGSLIGIAGLYCWLEVEFIAVVQIVVYVGRNCGSYYFLHFPHTAIR